MKYDKPEMLVIMFDEEETGILTYLSNGGIGGGSEDSDGDIIIDGDGNLIVE